MKYWTVIAFRWQCKPGGMSHAIMKMMKWWWIKQQSLVWKLITPHLSDHCVCKQNSVHNHFFWVAVNSFLRLFQLCLFFKSFQQMASFAKIVEKLIITITFSYSSCGTRIYAAYLQQSHCNMACGSPISLKLCESLLMID